jgi:hypothetical protein
MKNDTYDIRTALGVKKGGHIEFTVQKVRWLGRVCWLLKTPDPAVSLPAWLAVISVLLGVVGIVLGAVGIRMSL